MTPADLALELTPGLRQAATRSKRDVMAGLSPPRRFALGLLWAFLLKVGVPLLARMVIEFLIAYYRDHLEKTVGPALDLVADAIDPDRSPQLARVKAVALMLRTPKSAFLPAVQAALEGPDIDAEPAPTCGDCGNPPSVVGPLKFDGNTRDSFCRACWRKTNPDTWSKP